MGDEPSNDDTSHYEGALLEDIQDRIKLLAEAMADVPADVRQLKHDVSQLKDDMVIVKHAVTEQSADLDNHEQRIQRLEQRAA
jgi:septal ring factor EnvC (AmiA/AmiB activator)